MSNFNDTNDFQRTNAEQFSSPTDTYQTRGLDTGMGQGHQTEGLRTEGWNNPGPGGGMGSYQMDNQGPYTQGNTGAADFTGGMDSQMDNQGPYTQGKTGAADFTGTGRTAADLGATGVPKTGPSLGDKVIGNTEKLLGKATKQHGLVERGQERAHGRGDNM